MVAILTVVVIGILGELDNAIAVNGEVVAICLKVELDHSTITEVVLEKLISLSLMFILTHKYCSPLTHRLSLSLPPSLPLTLSQTYSN